MNSIFFRLLMIRSLFFVVVFLYIVLIFAMAGGSALAQATNPSSIDPGRLERQFEDRLEPRVAPEEIVKPIEEEEKKEGDSEVKFLLSGIRLSGNEVIGEADISPSYQEYIGKEVSFNTLNKIASAITEKYKNEGFILARAYIPPQKVEQGIVEIKIVEGFIDKVTVDGEVLGSRALLDSFISKIQASRPLKASILERYMLLMDDLPGVTARGLLRPSEKTVGAADLVITIKHERTELSFEANNRGTRYLGPYQFTSIVRANSWLERYDKTYVRFVTVNQSEELKFIDVYHSEPVGTEGATVSASIIRSNSQPGSTLKSSGLDSENVSIDTEYSHPFIRSREQNFFGRVGASYRETSTTSNGAPLTDDSVRVVRVGGQYDVVDSFDGVNLIDLEVAQGVDIWKSTNNDSGASRSNADNLFTKALLNLSRYQPFSFWPEWKNIGLLVAGVGQYATGPLFASEEIGIGGSSFGKAYDPSEISGDHGAAGKIELQYIKFLGMDYLVSYQAYGFYDGGAIWNDDPVSGESGRSTLQSTGLGVRMNFTDKLTGLLEVAFPLSRPVASEGFEDEHDPRFFFSIVNKF